MSSIEDPVERLEAERRDGRRRRVRYFWLAAGLLVLVVVVAHLTVYFTGKGRLRAAMERVQESGAPTSFEDLVRDSAREGESPGEWLDDLVDVREWWRDDEPRDADLRASALEHAREGLIGDSEALAALEALDEACRADAELRDRVERSLADPFALEGEGEHLLAAALSHGIRPVLAECPEDTCRFGGFTVEEIFRPIEPESALRMPELPITLLLRATHAFAAEAEAAVLLRDAPAVEQRLTQGFCLVGYTDSLYWAMPVLLRAAQQRRLLGVLRSAFGKLSPEVALSPVEDQLRAQAGAVEHLRRALEGERAWAIQTLGEDVRTEVLGDADPAREFFFGLFYSHAMADLLEDYEVQIAALRRPYTEAQSRLDDLRAAVESRRFSWISRMLLMNASRYLTTMTELEAERRLALFAFGLRRGEDPAQLAGRYADPFDGAPLRFTAEPAAVRIWSIGADGVDDGGSLEAGMYGGRKDLAWHVLTR